jgi:hypothetical protein
MVLEVFSWSGEAKGESRLLKAADLLLGVIDRRFAVKFDLPILIATYLLIVELDDFLWIGIDF